MGAQFEACDHQDWKYVTKSNPCSLCGQPNWCSVSPDGGCDLFGVWVALKSHKGGRNHV